MRCIFVGFVYESFGPVVHHFQRVKVAFKQTLMKR